MSKKFIEFLKYPKISEPPISLSFQMSILLIFRSFFLYIVAIFFFSILFLPVLKVLNLVPKFGFNSSDIPLSFKALILAPIFEEIIFRLPLKFSKQNFFLFLACLHFLLFSHAYKTSILCLISFIIALIPYLKLIPEPPFFRLKILWGKYFYLIYYGFAIFFGLVHMSNFVNLTFAHFLFFPLIVFNQIAMGLILGYVRVTYLNGFILGVIIHILINLPFILIPHL